MFPLTVEVTRLRLTGVCEDAFGNTIPLVASEEPLLVFSFRRGPSNEPSIPEHLGRVTVDAEIVAASGDLLPTDKVAVPGEGVFEVVGFPSNFDANPWWSPGVETVTLRKVNG